MKQVKYFIYLVFFLQVAIVLFFWFSTSGSELTFNLPSSLIALGRLSGLLLALSVLTQFILRGRMPPLEKILGYETLNFLHKKNGYVVFTFLILHPALLIIGYSISGKINLIDQFIQFIAVFESVWLAFAAWMIFITVICTSIYLVRRKIRYEVWYFIHFMTYLAIFLAWFHQLKVGTDFLLNPWFVYYWYFLYFVTFLSVIYFRFINILLIFNKHRFYVEKIEKETSDAVSVYIKGKNLERFSFTPGQFLFVRFLTKEFGRQLHPFSFSSIPNNKYIRITIKNEGDFTSRIHEIKQGTKVIIDGPHGNFTEKFMTKNKIIYIAGGVGITPIRPLLENVKNKEQILFYSNKTLDDIIFQKELEELSKKNPFTIYNVISRDESYKGIKGRINLALISNYIKNVKDYDYYICGPVSMAKSIISELKSAGISSSQIHFEEFAL